MPDGIVFVGSHDALMTGKAGRQFQRTHKTALTSPSLNDSSIVTCQFVNLDHLHSPQPGRLVGRRNQYSQLHLYQLLRINRCPS